MRSKEKYLIIVSKFNDLITRALYEGAKRTFIEAGIKEENLETVWVPGVFELPVAAKKASESSKWSGIVTLGCVIRGETPHFDFVAGQAASGIMNASIQSLIPIAFGVLTTDTAEQALSRSGLKGGNKGEEAALTALTMTQVMNKL